MLNPSHAYPVPCLPTCLAPANPCISASTPPAAHMCVGMCVVGANHGGQPLVVVPQAAAPSGTGHQGPAASDADCLGSAAASQHHPSVSHLLCRASHCPPPPTDIQRCLTDVPHRQLGA